MHLVHYNNKDLNWFFNRIKWKITSSSKGEDACLGREERSLSRVGEDKESDGGPSGGKGEHNYFVRLFLCISNLPFSGFETVICKGKQQIVSLLKKKNYCVLLQIIMTNLTNSI